MTPGQSVSYGRRMRRLPLSSQSVWLTLQCVLCPCWRIPITRAVGTARVHGRRRLPGHGGRVLVC